MTEVRPGGFSAGQVVQPGHVAEHAVAEGAGETPQPLALELERLEKLSGALGGAPRRGGAAKARVFGQVFAFANRFERVAVPSGELFGGALVLVTEMPRRTRYAGMQWTAA